MNTKSSERSWLLYRGVTMRRNDSCNFRICEYPPIKICYLYQNEKVIIRQKISNKGWGYHGSVRGDTINRCVGVPWIGMYNEVSGYNKIIASEKGDWIVKGFIDIYKNIYTITIDTKVVSKVMEILLIPAFQRFAKKYHLTLQLPSFLFLMPDEGGKACFLNSFSK